MASRKTSKTAPAKPQAMNAVELKAFVEGKRMFIKEQVSELRAYLNDNIAPSRFHGAGWSTPNVRERDLTRFDREQVIAYARELVDKFPIVAGIVQAGADHVVGTGFILTMLTDDKIWNRDVEQIWDGIKDTIDIRQVRSWGQLQRMWYVRRFVDGDVGIMRQGATKVPKVAPHDGPLEYYKKRDVPMTMRTGAWLNTIEADRIRCRKYDFLDQGVGFSDDGIPLSYFIGPRPEHQLDWDSIMKRGKWVSADDMKLFASYTGERADQLRGQSVILQSFNVLRQIAEVLDAVTEKIKNEAFMAAQFISESTYGGNVFGDQSETKVSEDGISREHLNVLKGSILTPAAGEKLDLVGMKSPNAELIPFVRFLVRYAGSASGFPLELMLMDMGDTNFSGGRMVVELAKKRFRVEQEAMGKLCSWGAMWALQNNKELSKVSKTAGLNPWNHKWGKPCLPYFNPQQEANANEVMLRNYLVSPQDLIADQGEHGAEHVLDAWQAWKLACKERDLQVNVMGMPVPEAGITPASGGGSGTK